MAPGAYEVLAAPQLCAVFAASVPSTDDDAPGDVLDPQTGARITSFSTGGTKPGDKDSVHFFVNLSMDVVYSAIRNEAYVTYYGINQQDRIGTGGLVVVDAEKYARRHELAIKPFPSNLSLDEARQVLFLSVTEPSHPEHPDRRPGAVGSVMRLDLQSLTKHE